VRFVDEEGARFGVPCAGSRLLTGALDPGDLLSRVDADGTTYAEAVRAAGIDPETLGGDKEALRRVGTFVELHLEQGYALHAVDAPLGVGRIIRPHGRWRVEIEGRADHAGTALLGERSDALLELARLVQTTRATASRHDALGTVGRVEVRPNAVNTVPGHVTAWVDVRADGPGQVRSVVGELGMAGYELVEESWTPATVFSETLAAQLATWAQAELELPRPVPGMVTGAGHDAGVLASAGVNAGMLFVRNPTGVSHAPDEYADPADCLAGVRALAAALAELVG
jgi:N-carbamoyl-L-amino-acid hydrolase